MAEIDRDIYYAVYTSRYTIGCGSTQIRSQIDEETNKPPSSPKTKDGEIRHNNLQAVEAVSPQWESWLLRRHLPSE